METDKVVMGARKDSLHDMVKFSGNEGAIVWPLWKNDLMERIRYELGQKAVQIVGREHVARVAREDEQARYRPLLRGASRSRSAVPSVRQEARAA